MTTPVQEGLQNQLGGMNASLDPYLLQAGTYAFGLNLTSRGGLPRTRPSLVDFGVTIPTGKFQGAKTYRLNQTDRIVFGIAGYVYSLKLSDLSTTNHGSLLSSTVDRFYWEQADRYLIVQDGDPSTSWAAMNWPVIVHEDGLITQTGPKQERVPKGGPMAYVHGRLFVATNYIYESGAWTDNLGRTGFVAGDIIKQYAPEDVLKFTEANYLNEGGRFSQPEELGFITHMTAQKNIMSGIGQGPLIVALEHGFSAYQVNAPRTQWKDIDLAVVLFSGVGTRSPYSFIHDNADIIFRSDDAILTLTQAIAEAQGAGLASRPISWEVQPILDEDDADSLPLVSGAMLDQRIFMTVQPEDSIFKGILSLDKQAIGSLVAPGSPIYDGAWTGLDVHQVLTARVDGIERLLVFAQDIDGNNRLFIMDESAYNDEGNSQQLVRLYTGYKAFGEAFALKRMKFIELWASDVRGEVDVTAYVRRDEYPLWVQLSSGTFNADPTGEDQAFRKVRFTLDVDTCGQIDGVNLDSGYAFQFCIEWRGHMKLKMARFVADRESGEDYTPACNYDGTSGKIEATSGQIALDDYTYRIV